MQAPKPEAAASESSSQEAKIAFIRRLASPDKKTREKAISLLTVWLTSQDYIDEHDLFKIWKGLFYCVWHADKVPVQVDLVERLASILEKLEVELAFQFFSVFLSTMRREWAGIDRLRLDKFYLLLRKYLVHMFMVLENQEWDSNWTKRFMNAFEERAFLANDRYSAQGINFHYAEIFLSELQKFTPLKEETFTLLFEGFCKMLAKICDMLLLERLKESIFIPLLQQGHAIIKVMQEGGEVDVCKDNIGVLVLSAPLASVLFQIASLPSTPQPNRKVLYELHLEFCKFKEASAFSSVTLSPSISKRLENEHKENSSGNLSEDLGGSLEVSTAICMLENMKCHAKRNGNVQKPKSEDKSAKSGEKCQKISSISAIIQETHENPLMSQERILHDNNLDMPKAGSSDTISQATDENLPYSQEKIPGDNGLEEHDPVISNLTKQFDFIAAKGRGDLHASDLRGSLDVSTAIGMLGNMKCYGKRKGSLQKPKSEDKLAKNGEKCQKISSISAIIQETHENTLLSQEMILHDNNLDVSKSGSSDTNSQGTDENLQYNQEKIRDDNGLEKHDPVMSNLRKQFNLIAEKGTGDIHSSDLPMSFSQILLPKSKGSKKRKRQKAEGFPFTCSSRSCQENDISPCSLPSGPDFIENTYHKKKRPRLSHSNGKLPCSPQSMNSSQLKLSQEKCVSTCLPRSSGFDSPNIISEKKKKVRFALKYNLVWKPFSPLPPQILRVPPSATPRGSALKKGVPPGPIIVVKEAVLKPKKRSIRRPSSAQRTRKRLKNLASLKSLKRHS